ncbi:hypothetical protein PWYN_24515 [Paenibacillus wynnii]|uniref:Uncharacterized protein n=1 Tax=Paenibacillus wynnii TaxID=268407 RepID=A0A098M589_9BACL|nr:hypothetical protein PWYN_24515 [Paenibacillus wynnii]
MDISTDNFQINNINFVATSNHVYLAGGYFLKLTEGNKSINNIIIDGSVSGKRLLDIGIVEP